LLVRREGGRLEQLAYDPVRFVPLVSNGGVDPSRDG
jgi:hypothetical protein